MIDKHQKLYFIDFEYAGWDDPAKFLADFFAQPRFEAPKRLYKDMRQFIANLLPIQHQQAFFERVPVINKIIRLKWCYIILNSVHPKEKQRRDFALIDPESDQSTIDKVLNLL